MQPKPIIVVQGGQWGSEAKGVTTAQLCLSRHVNIAIRTGAINAGHTVVFDGKRYAMQQIPCGWVNPETVMVIGPGAYIHPPTLWREIDAINAAMPGRDIRDRLYIDFRCGVHDERAEGASKEANRHHRIGATGKGCSEAIVSKIRDRNNGCELFMNSPAGKDFMARNRARFVDTVQLVNGSIDKGAQVLIEGTQGTLLDLHLGPYPFTTSRMTSAANWIAEAGLSPALEYEVVLVCRTYPIRVAGNSGPMSNEIEWTDLARVINAKLVQAGKPPKVHPDAIEEFERCLQAAAEDAIAHDRYSVPVYVEKAHTRLSEWGANDRSVYRVAASELHRDALGMCSEDTVDELRRLFEMTTVTKKLRRLAAMHLPDIAFAIAVNRPSWICLTFLDYVEPELACTTSEKVAAAAIDDMHPMHKAVQRARHYIMELQSKLNVPIKMVGTGPETEHMFAAQYLKHWASVR